MLATQQGAERTALLECPVCGTQAPIEAAFRDIVLHRCPDCDHCFTDVGALEYLGVYDEAWEALHQNWFDHPNVPLFELIAQTLERDRPGGTVIDVGAGRGELLEYLHGRLPSATLTGLDISLAPSIEGVEIIRGDATSVDLGDRRWDAVVSLATIEHIAHVRSFTARLRELLVPAGLAIVMTVDDRSVLYTVARSLNRVGSTTPFERLYDRFHLNHFNSSSLRRLMENSGFTTLAHVHHNTPLAAVDMPKESALLRAGVWGTFVLGRMSGRTYEQTLISRLR
jgi:SAM-dependent methyltransferase